MNGSKYLLNGKRLGWRSVNLAIIVGGFAGLDAVVGKATESDNYQIHSPFLPKTQCCPNPMAIGFGILFATVFQRFELP